LLGVLDAAETLGCLILERMTETIKELIRYSSPIGSEPMKDNLSDYIRSAYSSAIGKKRRELVTPALILDLDIARRNISTMTEKLSHLHAKLRPHVKVQKCTELALMQVEAGAIGVCTATVWEAITMSRAGIKDVYRRGCPDGWQFA
jgi:hypothetical protein